MHNPRLQTTHRSSLSYTLSEEENLSLTFDLDDRLPAEGPDWRESNNPNDTLLQEEDI